MKLIALAAVGLAAIPVPAAAQESWTERIHFERGASSEVIHGIIIGYQTADYLVNARAGQVLHVTLQTSNASSYFNVWAPGVDEAMFVGSTTASRFSGPLPADGDYRIQVYLMRNAARRNERANYALTVGVR